MADEGVLFRSNVYTFYNGVRIDNILKSDVTASPIENEQKTTVKYVKYTVQIEAIVTPESFVVTADDRTTTGDALELIRQKLLENRKLFIYYDKGFGDFVVDTTTTAVSIGGEGITPKVDVMYGPKVKNLRFEPMAGNKAARINWSVEVHIAKDCTGTSKPVLEFWSTTKVQIKKSGYQTLTRTGKLEVVGNSDSETMSAGVDSVAASYIGSLTNPTSMEGYHLEHNFDISPDNRILTFTLVYTEIESPNAYPLGVVDIQCEHTMSSNLLSSNPLSGAGFRSWKNGMSCTVMLRPNVPQVRAWAIFAALASDRINQSVGVDTDVIDGAVTIVRVRIPLVLSLEIKESLFTHSITFNMTWVSFTNSIANILFNPNDPVVSGGMFKPFVQAGEGWNEWVVDVRNTVQRVGGAYLVSDNGITETIVDNCTSTISPSIPGTNRGTLATQVPAIFSTTCPPSESSWLDYKVKYELESSSNKSVHRRYKSINDILRSDDQIPPHTESTSTTKQYDTNSVEDDHFVQDFGTDKHYGIITGYAVRLGRSTEPPRVITIGGKSVILQKDKSTISNVVLDSSAGCPIHVTKWRLKYEILGYPDGNVVTTTGSTGGPGNFQ